MTGNKERWLDANFSTLKIICDGTELTEDKNSGELFIKKYISPGNVSVYKTLMDIHSIHLACVSDVFERDGEYFALTEYAPGEALADYIESGRIFSERETVGIVSQLCDGLSLLHSRGVIHRDISPSNIIISRDYNVRLIDYGISRIPKKGRTRDTAVLGTAGYAAPEQFGFAQTDCRSDIYSLGVLMNVMLTGALPAEKRYTGKLGKVIDKCISIDAQKRFDSVDSLKNALNGVSEPNLFSSRFLDGLPGFKKRNPFFIAIGIIYYLFIAVIVVAGYVDVIGKGYLKVISLTANIFIAVVLPYIMVANPFNLRDKMPIFKNATDKDKIIIAVALSIGLVLLGLFGFSYVST